MPPLNYGRITGQDFGLLEQLSPGSIVQMDSALDMVFVKMAPDQWARIGTKHLHSDLDVLCSAIPQVGWIRHVAQPVGFVRWDIHLECPDRDHDVYSSFVEWDLMDEEQLPYVSTGEVYPTYRLGNNQLMHAHAHGIRLSTDQIQVLPFVHGNELLPNGFPDGFVLTPEQSAAADQLRLHLPKEYR